MNPIRPNPASIGPAPAPRATAEARAAFFQAVLSGQAQVQAPAQAPVTARTAVSAPTAAAVQIQAAAPPEGERYRRPGSILDIKV